MAVMLGMVMLEPRRITQLPFGPLATLGWADLPALVMKVEPLPSMVRLWRSQTSMRPVWL